MQSRPMSFHRLLAVVAAGFVTALTLADSIVLRTSVRLADNETVIRLRDIAYLDGDAAVRLGDMQVADLGQSASLEVSLDEIRAKLLSASATANLIDLSGKSVTVRSAKAGKPVAMRGLAVDAGSAAVASPETAIARVEFLADDATDIRTPRGLISELLRNAYAAQNVRLRLVVSGTDEAFLDQRPSTRRFEIFPLTSLTADVVRMRVLSRDGDVVASRTEITVVPTLEATVATATASVRKGATIDGAIDVQSEWVKPSEYPKLLPVSAIGDGVANTTIDKGARLTNDSLRKPIEIRRNDKVTIRREMGTVAIEVAAIAEEDGAIGQQIRFRAVDRKDRRDQRTFFAEVLGSGRAIIRNGTTLVSGGNP
jgi:flagella basal body P-ring formation protein FlgA